LHPFQLVETEYGLLYSDIIGGTIITGGVLAEFINAGQIGTQEHFTPCEGYVLFQGKVQTGLCLVDAPVYDAPVILQDRDTGILVEGKSGVEYQSWPELGFVGPVLPVLIFFPGAVLHGFGGVLLGIVYELFEGVGLATGPYSREQKKGNEHASCDCKPE